MPDYSKPPDYSNEDLPYAGLINGATVSQAIENKVRRRSSIGDQTEQSDSWQPLKDLLTLYQIFGAEAFKILGKLDKFCWLNQFLENV